MCLFVCCCLFVDELCVVCGLFGKVCVCAFARAIACLLGVCVSLVVVDVSLLVSVLVCWFVWFGGCLIGWLIGCVFARSIACVVPCLWVGSSCSC